MMSGAGGVAFLLCLARPLSAAQWFNSKARAEGDTLYKSAFAAYDAGDYAQAQVLLNQAEKLKPDQADGWNLRGAVDLKQGAYDKADAAFSRAMILDPALWAAQFNYAESAFQSKRYPIARTRFDRLVDQTNRFKDKNRWELAQYKAFLSSLLMNDDLGAQKRLAKLPTAGAATPAGAYAQAAIAFRRKDLGGAEKLLAGAQAAFSPSLNGLFSDSLVTLGWQAPAQSTMPPAALASAASLSNPPTQPAFVIDPKVEAAAAEPLPAAGPRNASSSLQPVPPTLPTPGPAATSPSDALLHQSPTMAKVSPTPTPVPDSALERGTLLD